MKLLCIFALALAATTVSANQCDDIELTLLLDNSENAARASSTDISVKVFDMIQKALQDLLNNNLVKNANNFRLGVYGYTSDSVQPVEYVARGSSVTQAATGLTKIGQEITLANAGGSWTYNGFKPIMTGPTTAKKGRLLVISSQGSVNAARRAKTVTEVNRVVGLGWNVSVIAVQGMNDIDYEELTAVNQGVRPEALQDPNPTMVNGQPNPQGYKVLSNALKVFVENTLCPAGGSVTTTTTTTTTPTTTTTTTTTTPKTQTKAPTTPPPGTGGNNPSPPGSATPSPTPIAPVRINGTCSSCLFAGGYGYDFDEYCDTFFVCMPNTEPIKKQCPSGTFWDGAQCNYINKVRCPQALCNADTAAGTKYPSGRCCNKYYECKAGKLFETACAAGLTFNADSSQCETPANKTLVCSGTGRFECDVSLTGPVNTTDCNGYAPDPYGDPCKFQYAGYILLVPSGTIWDQDQCSLVHNDQNLCLMSQISNDTFFYGSGGPAEECNAIFLANFDGGSRSVYSERLGLELSVHSILQEAQLSDDALVFTSEMTDPFLYYYFFNNREINTNTAFKLRFKLDSPELNKPYDLLSNEYCSLCPGTISFSVTATSNTKRVVSAMFLTNMGNTVNLEVEITKQNADEELELIVIFGDDAVYGQVNALTASGDVRTSVEFERQGKTAGATGMINRCGFQLGRGPNKNNFVGMIDEFAVYEYCADIDSVLR